MAMVSRSAARSRGLQKSAAYKKATTKGSSTIPPTVIRRAGRVVLNIPARSQAPESPRAGWCGETAIQEALLFHGAFFPQRAINKAGKPSHPDLYASDIPRALEALGADYASYSWGVAGFTKFHKWLRARIGQGEPVLAGMKIHPSQHPRWGLDHFVLAVGYDARSVTVNTTWGRRATRTLKQLTTRARGLSFKNPYDRYYGIRIRGFRGRASAERPVHLFVTKETETKMWVQIKCEGLRAKGRYRVRRYAAHRARAKAVRSWTFTATGEAQVLADRIDKGRPALYRCAPISD